MTSPSLFTNTADQPARRALECGPPRTAPSVKPTPVKVKSSGVGLPPHDLATSLGVAGTANLTGTPCRNKGSLQCSAL